MDFAWPTLPPPATAYRAALGALPSMPVIDAGAAIDTGAAASSTAARNLGLVQRPVAAAASGLKVSPLTTAARLIGRTLTIAVIGASAMQGAKIVSAGGPRALINTREGRGALFGAVGGTLVLVPTPVTQLGGAAMFALLAANEFGMLKRFDSPQASAVAAAATAPG